MTKTIKLTLIALLVCSGTACGGLSSDADSKTETQKSANSEKENDDDDAQGKNPDDEDSDDNQDPSNCSGPNPVGCTSDSDCQGPKICNTDPCKPTSCTCTPQGYACTDDCGGGVCQKPEDPPNSTPPSSPDCAPQQISTEGQCAAVLGYIWDGQKCAPIGGCKCTGDNCDNMFDTKSNCQKAYAQCSDSSDPQPPSCDGPNPAGCTTDADCGGNEVCNTDAECKPSSCECTESGYVCTDDCGGGICEPADTTPPDSCKPQDARGKGNCEAFFGYRWNGDKCIAIGGCECKGDDCGDLPMDKSQCSEAFAQCKDG